jgi:hypothetical protein
MNKYCFIYGDGKFQRSMSFEAKNDIEAYAIYCFFKNQS